MRKTRLSAIIAATCALVLVVPFATALSSCKKKTDENGGVIKESDVVFTQNGTTDFRIVISDDAADKENFAKDELIEFVRQATGATLSVVSPEEAVGNGKYVVLGDCEKRNGSGETFTRSELGKSGYKIIRKDKTLYISGASKYGTLAGVYRFLKEMFGYEFFAPEEIVIEKKPTCRLLDFDLSFKPAIDVPTNDFQELVNDTQSMYRYGFVEYPNDWALFAHSYFTIVPPSVYYYEHRNWYSPDCLDNGKSTKGEGNGNLCLSNVDRDIFFENLADIIEANPAADYVSLGQMDNFIFCDCDDCTATMRNNGWTESTLAMEFTNDMARRIKKRFPERELEVVAFAYNATLKPPVKEENDKITLLSPAVKAEDNVSVMVVPRSFNYSYGYDSSLNKVNYDYLKGWHEVCDSIMIWEYVINFDEPIMNYNIWGSMQNMYSLYADYNVSWIFDECGGSISAVNPEFSYMRLYVMSNLTKNPKQSVEALIEKFLKQYYKNACEPIKQLFEFVRTYEVTLESRGKYAFSGGSWTNLDYWSYPFIRQCKNLISEAYSEIDELKSSDSELYEKLYTRIEKESLFSRYLELKLYQDRVENYSDEWATFLSDCNKHGIYYVK